MIHYWTERPTRCVNGCPQRQQSKHSKISKPYILTPPQPQGHVISGECEQPLDELAVQVWLQYHQPNFKYCALFVSRTEYLIRVRWTSPAPYRYWQTSNGKFLSGCSAVRNVNSSHLSRRYNYRYTDWVLQQDLCIILQTFYCKS